jgi:hypothetical protein
MSNGVDADQNDQLHAESKTLSEKKMSEKEAECCAASYCSPHACCIACIFQDLGRFEEEELVLQRATEGGQTVIVASVEMAGSDCDGDEAERADGHEPLEFSWQ